MKVSVIIPSSLTPRKNQASNLEMKLIRAIQSVLMQDYKPIECILVADGCAHTIELMDKYDLSLESWLKIYHIPKQPLFSGNVRNYGIEKATGDIICYLDADDVIGPDHVSTIVEHFTGDWVWFNDMTLQGDEFKERECSLKLGLCGTSNIAHLRSMPCRWREINRYGYDDWNFIQQLILSSPGVKIETPSYVVCHIPFKNGYDV
jgi:glycosyltransferase involved in cell wall biosynthesis